MGFKDYFPGMSETDPVVGVGEQLANVKGDADAVALLPYDDGTFYLKPAHFDKELLGGQGGYETEDGDKIVLDGKGDAVKELMGVPMLLACDPTEHAAAVDPMKALVAHKNNIGEWIKVDSKANVIEAGKAIEQIEREDAPDIDVGYEGTDVEEFAEENNVTFEKALEELEANGTIEKIMDISPPGGVAVTDGGELMAEQATHIAVNQSDAASLLPTTTSTTELNTALDKARMEEHEEGKLMQWFIYGLISGSIIVAIVAMLMFIVTTVL